MKTLEVYDRAIIRGTLISGTIIDIFNGENITATLRLDNGEEIKRNLRDLKPTIYDQAVYLRSKFLEYFDGKVNEKKARNIVGVALTFCGLFIFLIVLRLIFR